MIFLSYRKSDTTPETRSLKILLDQLFGADASFMDSFSIDSGEAWNERLRYELNKARIFIPIIGPSWLIASNEFGQRLLDRPDDWLRWEIEAALKRDLEVIPLLVRGAQFPRPEALPESIRPICQRQCYELRDSHWRTDISPFIETLEKHISSEASIENVVFPELCDHVSRILSEAELRSKLEDLKSWRVRPIPIPGKRSEKGSELVRKYEFTSFPEAIRFMHEASDHIEQTNHHPKWENVWISLVVHLSTWNIGHKISVLDIDLAYYLDDLFNRGYAKK